MSLAQSSLRALTFEAPLVPRPTGAFRVCGAPVCARAPALRADAPTGARAPQTLCTHQSGLGTLSVPDVSQTSPEGGLLLLAAHQNIPPRPGAEPSTTQSAPAPSGGPPPDAGFGGGILPLLVMVVPMLLLLFFTSRSQQKKQAAALAALKKGDRVLTQSGLVGRLVEMGDRFAKLEISPGVKVEVLKSQLLGVDSAETQASAEKK